MKKYILTFLKSLGISIIFYFACGFLGGVCAQGSYLPLRLFYPYFLVLLIYGDNFSEGVAAVFGIIALLEFVLLLFFFFLRNENQKFKYCFWILLIFHIIGFLWSHIDLENFQNIPW